jgi:hypothetical protein
LNGSCLTSVTFSLRPWRVICAAHLEPLMNARLAAIRLSLRIWAGRPTAALQANLERSPLAILQVLSRWDRGLHAI